MIMFELARPSLASRVCAMVLGQGMPDRPEVPSNLFAGAVRTTISGREDWTLMVDTKAGHDARMSLTADWAGTQVWAHELRAIAQACQLAADLLDADPDLELELVKSRSPLHDIA